MDTKDILSTNLRYLREEVDGLSQAAYSEELGIPYSTYKTYELGKHIPKPAVIDKIARRFNIEIYQLFVKDISESLKSSHPAGDSFVSEVADLSKAVDNIAEKLKSVTKSKSFSSRQWDQMVEVDSIFIASESYLEAEAKISEDVLSEWLLTFQSVRCEYGIARTALFYSKFQRRKRTPVTQGSPFGDPPAWFKELFPNHKQLICSPIDQSNNQEKELG